MQVPESDDRWSLAPHVAWQQIDGEALLIDLKSGQSLGLNPVGSLIWSLLSSAASPGEVIAEITRRFDVPAETASGDFHDFMASLQKRGLVERVR